MPTHSGGQARRDVVHGLDTHAEDIRVAGVQHLVNVARQQEFVIVAIAGPPRDGIKIKFARVERGGKHGLADEGVTAAFVEHGQQVVFHILEFLQQGGNGDGHVDGLVQVGVEVHRRTDNGTTVRGDVVSVVAGTLGHSLVLVQREVDGAKHCAREVGAVGQVEVHDGRSVDVGTHLGRVEVLYDVHMVVAGDGGATLVPCARIGLRLGVGVRRGRGEVPTRGHHQAEGRGGVVQDVFHTAEVACT